MTLKIFLTKNTSKNNFISEIFLNIYSFLTSLIEKIIFRKKFLNNELNKNGFNLYKTSKNLLIQSYEMKTVESNKYLSKLIFSQEDINNLISNFFIKNRVSDLITSKTGFKYSIDFMTAYETKHINEEDLQQRWFANHWHRDKPFSRNTLKIIIPIENITKNHGGIEIKKNRNDKEVFKMISDTDNFLAFFSNRCFHKAGNPDFKLVRKQLMFQLNPSNKWKINSNLFSRQYFIEPKFPLFSYIFDKKIELKKLI